MKEKENITEVYKKILPVYDNWSQWHEAFCECCSRLDEARATLKEWDNEFETKSKTSSSRFSLLMAQVPIGFINRNGDEQYSYQEFTQIIRQLKKDKRTLNSLVDKCWIQLNKDIEESGYSWSELNLSQRGSILRLYARAKEEAQDAVNTYNKKKLELDKLEEQLKIYGDVE